MLGDADLVAFAPSRNLEVSDRFYGGVLGLRVLEASEVANAYDANGTQLRVTLVDRVADAPYTVLGWRVLNIVTTIRALREVGVVFVRYEGMTQDDFDVWTAPGDSQVAWFAGPDGNILSLQQAPAN